MLEPKLFNELRLSLDRDLASGHLATAAQIEQQIKIFQERFGPPVLRQLDGEALLKLMHGRDDPGAFLVRRAGRQGRFPGAIPVERLALPLPLFSNERI